MRSTCLLGLGCSAVWLTLSAVGQAQGPSPNVVFMEPDDAAAAEPLTTYRRVEDAYPLERYGVWLDNESGRLAFGLYERAWRATQAGGQAGLPPPPFHIALVPGGNHAAVGFRLKGGSALQENPSLGYVKLGPEPGRFRTTFPPETGHVVLATLAGGKEIAGEQIASIPHTTAALTDRATAFSEGFAIHLETLAAHLSADPETRGRYRHERFDFGNMKLTDSQYFRHAADLLTFSQTLARYEEVRENNLRLLLRLSRAGLPARALGESPRFRRAPRRQSTSAVRRLRRQLLLRLYR